MPYQVTMDRTLSESEINRLVQSELSRRQYNTALGHLSDEEFIAKWKEDTVQIKPILLWILIRL